MNLLLILTFLVLPAKAEVVDKIEAHVGNRIITSYDVEMLNPALYKNILSIADERIMQEQLQEYKEQALNFLIDMNIMEIAAERDGIKISDKDVDRAVKEIAASNKMTMEQFEKTLQKENLSLNQYRYQIKGQMIMRSKISVPQIVITEEDINNMIDERAGDFGLKDKYKIKIITAQRKSDIKSIIKNVKTSDEFSKAAKEHSLSESASKGGDLGFQDTTYMPIEMVKAIRDTKVGAITKPFKYENQWAVCFVEDFISKYEIDDNTKQKIQNAIGEKLFQQAVDKWMKKNKESIVVFRASDKFKVQ